MLGKLLPYGSYAGIVYAGIFLILWITVVVPIYCIKYYKCIREEKLKFLFAVYNPLIIAICYSFGSALSSFGTILKSAIFIFVWGAVWTILPLVIRIDSTKKQNENKLCETQE